MNEWLVVNATADELFFIMPPMKRSEPQNYEQERPYTKLCRGETYIHSTI
jgi:hypothetical protein